MSWTRRFGLISLLGMGLCSMAKAEVASPVLPAQPVQPTNAPATASLLEQFDFAKPAPPQQRVSAQDASSPERAAATPPIRAATPSREQDSSSTEAPVITSQQLRRAQQPLVPSTSPGVPDDSASRMTSAVPQQRVLPGGVQLEPTLSQHTASEMLAELASMQQTIQQLQGELEVQHHLIQLLSRQHPNLKMPSSATATDASVSAQRVAATQAVLDGPNADVADARSTAGTTLPKAPATSVEENLVFEAAFNELQTKHYQQAMQDMERFVKDFPQSTHLPEAYYWLGEMDLISGNESKAVLAFQRVVKQYPTHARGADALLKLGLLAYGKGQWQAAKNYFRLIVARFPESSSATFARRRLKQMLIAGH